MATVAYSVSLTEYGSLPVGRQWRLSRVYCCIARRNSMDSTVLPHILPRKIYNSVLSGDHRYLHCSSFAMRWFSRDSAEITSNNWPVLVPQDSLEEGHSNIHSLRRTNTGMYWTCSTNIGRVMEKPVTTTLQTNTLVHMWFTSSNHLYSVLWFLIF